MRSSCREHCLENKLLTLTVGRPPDQPPPPLDPPLVEFTNVSFEASKPSPACYVSRGLGETNHYVFIRQFRPRLSIYIRTRTSVRGALNTVNRKYRGILSSHVIGCELVKYLY